MASEVKDLQVQDVEKQEIAEIDAERTRDRRAFVPRGDICETKDALIVAVDLPGYPFSAVDASLEMFACLIKCVLELGKFVTGSSLVRMDLHDAVPVSFFDILHRIRR